MNRGDQDLVQAKTPRNFSITVKCHSLPHIIVHDSKYNTIYLFVFKSICKILQYFYVLRTKSNMKRLASCTHNNESSKFQFVINKPSTSQSTVMETDLGTVQWNPDLYESVSLCSGMYMKRGIVLISTAFQFLETSSYKWFFYGHFLLTFQMTVFCSHHHNNK